MKRTISTLALVATTAFLGNHALADDAAPPRQERKGPLVRFDKNGDGILDAAEIQAAKENMTQLFDDLDTNKDGTIDQAELAAGKGNARKRQGGNDAGQRERMRDHMMKRFDTDGDGKLSDEEKAAADAARQEMIKKYDTDGDGKLSLDERKEMMKEHRKNRPGKGGGKKQDMGNAPVIVE